MRFTQHLPTKFDAAVKREGRIRGQAGNTIELLFRNFSALAREAGSFEIGSLLFFGAYTLLREAEREIHVPCLWAEDLWHSAP